MVVKFGRIEVVTKLHRAYWSTGKNTLPRMDQVYAEKIGHHLIFTN